MQSPLLHQVSSLRDSLLCEAPSHHPYPGPSLSDGLRPRLAIPPPLSSLRPDNGSILTSTLLDVGNTSSFSDTQPLSKSDQDLAHYLATSNHVLDGSMQRDSTMLSSDWSVHSIGSMFERGGDHHQQSWGNLDPSPPTPLTAVSPLAGNALKLYSPHADYSLHQARRSSWSSSSQSLSNPASRRGSVSYQSPVIPESRRNSMSYQHSPAPGLPPLGHPLPSSLLRVNVNTSPRIPISPHLQPQILPARTSVCVEPGSVSLELDGEADHGSSYPEEERFVNLSDLYSHSEPTEGRRKMVLRSPPASKSSASVVVCDSSSPRGLKRPAEADDLEQPSKRHCDSDKDKRRAVGEEDLESAVSDDESYESEVSDDEEYEDTDDQEFIPGRRSTSRRTARRRVKQEPDDDYILGPRAQRMRVGKRTGSAAAALKALTALASGERESISVPPPSRLAPSSQADNAPEGYPTSAYFPPLPRIKQDYARFPPLNPLSGIKGPEPVYATRSVSASASASVTSYTSIAETTSRTARGAISVPVPVPNLTKKSRGRRVPISEDQQERPFICPADGCGKRFVRGEHLKRHVRSIHTHEKPHICPYEGCGKSFNRRDNLAQHSRIHFDDK
ncbi:hypothetical protein MIND_00307400 [Mycena indigotica]|uniref:C2H2-type domain-containing protein n=1 Tax=Mycena indigotica TaxID=2126181 RepID=A0A8H6T2W0_9AGAR|nr:uncharacterized protein MIND_00307400 [Mycena indigotica]KAF7309367.1 hypothetical protein MIND_00307400 [Mycena indigotica]